MIDLKRETEIFFRAYSQQSNAALKEDTNVDPERVGGLYATYFVGADPNGVMGGENNKAFREMIPKGYDHYRGVGGTRFEIVDMEITVLNDFSTMARTNWEFDYTRPTDGASGTISFQNIYFLNFAGGVPKVFAYITPDEKKVMREHGLL